MCPTAVSRIMYTRCSNCQFIHNVTVKQFRMNCGLTTCPACGHIFNIALSLTDRVDLTDPTLKPVGFHFKAVSSRSANWIWLFALILSLSTLGAQFFYFEGNSLIRQPQIRAGLQFLCSRFGCRLPEYQNLTEWSVSHSNLQISANKNYVFTAAMTNQSSFPQAMPKLKLILLDFSGKSVAERVFSAKEYFFSEVLPANETISISLSFIQSVGVKVGGYNLILL